MNSREKLKKEIDECTNSAAPIMLFLNGELTEEQTKDFDFRHQYQKWYSKALKIVEFLGKDRIQEFRSYYEIDPRRKSLGYGSYYIQDYLKAVVPGGYAYAEFDSEVETSKNVYNQYTILLSVIDRIDSVLGDIQTSLFVELQDNELETAKNLLKINLRASGVIAGVVLESYLANVTNNHKLKITKRNPTLSDFNESLKNNDIIDTTVWRKISYLSDIRNICAHKKDIEPTKDQVEELIAGVHWVAKNVF
jgi:hypothetical protein